MMYGDPVPWRTLDRWRAKAFLAAGGLFLVSPTAKALVLITDDSLPELVVALLAFSGLLAALVGLLGFYPELAEQVPRHALAGVVTTVIAAGVTIGVFVWLIGTRILTAMAYLAAPVPLPRLAFVSLVVAIAIGFAVVGTACLRAAVPPNTVGSLLVALAAPWFVLLGAGAVYGSNLPVLVSLSTYGAIPVGLLVTGYVIRKETSVEEQKTFAADITAN